jgi:peptidoglycan/LPS O-acetylase OafA/YrhL
VQFYAAVGLLCLIHRRALLAVPLLCLFVTGFRIFSAEPVSIVTWHRVDEILAGGIIALVYCGWLGRAPQAVLRWVPVPVAIGVLFACSYAGPLLYMRPYAGALVLGTAIYNLDRISARFLINRPARYVAEVSYALYVVHGMLMPTWLGTGQGIGKYLKRPLFFVVTFGVAHLSTFYLERPITRLVRTSRARGRTPSAA